ncbi:MAG: hypothetical protein ACOC7R_02865 [Planctomycetota bacterium]
MRTPYNGGASACPVYMEDGYTAGIAVGDVDLDDFVILKQNFGT